MTKSADLQLMIEYAAESHNVGFRTAYPCTRERTCLALTGSIDKIMAAIAAVHSNITTELYTVTYHAHTDAERERAREAYATSLLLHRQLGRAYNEGMGLRSVAYWPNLQPLEGQQDADEITDRDGL